MGSLSSDVDSVIRLAISKFIAGIFGRHRAPFQSKSQNRQLARDALSQAIAQTSQCYSMYGRFLNLF